MLLKLHLTIIALITFTIKINAQQQISNFTYEEINASRPSGFTEFNNFFVFEGSSDGVGRELWISEGTNETTTLIKDINTGNSNGASSPLELKSAILNNEFYFIARDETSDGEIWKSDGTTEGTVKITNFINGTTRSLTVVGSHLFFLVRTGEYTLQVWKSDGTSEGTVLVKDEISIWNTISYEGSCNGVFIFTIQTQGTNGSKVWRSDGTDIGTHPITEEIFGNGSGYDGYSHGGSSQLSQYIELNNKLYFASRDYLHETDGTIENTNIVAELWQTPTHIFYSDVIKLNNKLYFMFYSDDKKLSIWESDGTEFNTSQIYLGYNPNYNFFVPSNLMNADNSLIFSGPNQNNTTSLISLNLDNHETTYLTELTDVIVDQNIPMFFRDFHIGKIYKITNDEYYISSPIMNTILSDRKGWILNTISNNVNHISVLDGVFDATVFYEELFYSKDFQVWKYTDILNAENLDNLSSIIPYPNPSSDFIHFNNPNEIKSIKIFDLQGMLIVNLPKYDQKKINISHLKSGAYIIQLQSNNKFISKKIIKK